MRVKVESIAPLPHVKAWFSANSLQTILDFKTCLCVDLQSFKHAAIRAHDLVLILDDFELLDPSPIDVVRDGDLIIIKKASDPLTLKRKASSQDAGTSERKRTKIVHGRASNRAHSKKRTISTSSSSESDASSDASDSSDSDSSSDSSSDSDSDSSSSSISLGKTSRPKVTNGAPPTAQAQKPDVSKPAPPPVPPGFGKPTTHSRNLRRRRKKMYERIATTAEPTSVNEIPLGSHARTLEPPAPPLVAAPSAEPQPHHGKGKEKAIFEEAVDTNEPPLFMMATMQNKNKRRGFKDALKRGVPAKITFSATQKSAMSRNNADGGVDSDAYLVETSLRIQESPRRTQQPRLVPPSEKQELGQLPPNMFVTSVDVEEGMWPSKRNKNKKKTKQKLRAQEEEPESFFAGGLPYDDEAATSMPPSTGVAATGSTEHAVIAAQWDSLRKVTEKAQLSVGASVAWKALGINLATLTPEMLLHVARVAQCGEQIVVQPVAEAGAMAASFGGVGAGDEDEAAAEIFEWSDVLQGDWRLVVSH